MLGCATATPFGLPGGAGGVEHVAKRVGRAPALVLGERRVVKAGDRVARAVEHERLDARVGEAVGEAHDG